MPRCTATAGNGTQCSRTVRNGTLCYQHHTIHGRTTRPHTNHLETQHRFYEEARHRVQQNAEVVRHREELRVLEALARDQERIAQLVARRVIHAYGERRVHEDSQNVHRLDVRRSQEEILNALACKTPLPLKETLRLYRSQTPSRTFVQRLLSFVKRDTSFDYILDTALGNPEYFMMVKNSDGILRKIDLVDALNLTVYGVVTSPVEHRNILHQRLEEEVRDAKGYCVAGCYARILNTFAGFEEVVLGIQPVDPRSANQRVSDLFAALAKREIDSDAKRTEGERILTENGILGEAQSSWLEAL